MSQVSSELIVTRQSCFIRAGTASANKGDENLTYHLSGATAHHFSNQRRRIAPRDSLVSQAIRGYQVDCHEIGKTLMCGRRHGAILGAWQAARRLGRRLMDWRLKCLAFHALRYAPRSLYVQLQRRVTGRYLREVTEPVLWSYNFHVENFRKLSPGGRALEFGCGPDLLTPLLLSAAGAAEVLAYDIERMATVEQINHVISQMRTRVTGPWPQIETLGDLLPLYRVRYVAPGDVRDTGLPSGSIDFIYSTSTLEHIPARQIGPILTECQRILSARGLMSFRIDYHDHYWNTDPSITRFNFYRYPSAIWWLLNPAMHYQNRLRHSDYLQHFRNLDMLESTALTRDNAVVSVPLCREFAHYSKEDLLATNGLFTLRSKAGHGHGEQSRIDLDANRSAATADRKVS